MKRWWKSLTIGMLGLSALAATGAGAEPERRGKEYVGWVSDESCGTLHMEPGGADCVQKCIKGAPHLNPEWVAQRMVFVTDADGAIWFVANPESLKGEEGQHLRIQAVTLENEEQTTIRVLTKVRVDGSDER